MFDKQIKEVVKELIKDVKSDKIPIEDNKQIHPIIVENKLIGDLIMKEKMKCLKCGEIIGTKSFKFAKCKKHVFHTKCGDKCPICK